MDGKLQVQMEEDGSSNIKQNCMEIDNATLEAIRHRSVKTWVQPKQLMINTLGDFNFR